MGGRPLDVLEAALDEPVTVELKDGATYHGELSGYDQHMNLVLAPVDDGGEPDGIGDTTVIRGDNVVTIRT